MDKEISPAKDIKLYALGLVCLLAPIVIFQCLCLAEGEFFAIGSYVISSQSFVKSVVSFLITLFGSDFSFLLDVLITVLWLLAGIISLVGSILSAFRKSWSHRRKVAAFCGLAGYILTYAWRDVNPPQRQIEYVLHSKIPSGSTPEQVIKVLSSQGICHYPPGESILAANVPYNNEEESTFIIIFHFTNKKLQNFSIVQQAWADPSCGQ